MEGLVIYCADIGSVQKNNFAWARLPYAKVEGFSPGGSRQSIQDLATAVAADLQRGSKVALGFECPLFVPLPDHPEKLTAARQGEGDRPWSAGAGASCLATGLTETVWILERIRARLTRTPPVYLDWRSFVEATEGLFFWEAFVTQDSKLSSNEDDAETAVTYFESAMPKVDEHDAVRNDRVRSLIGAAILQAGWSTNLNLLAEPCLVLRPPAPRARLKIG